MTGSDDAVRRARADGVEPVLILDGFVALRAAHAHSGQPNLREREQLSVLVEREPLRRLTRLDVSILAERRHRHETALHRPEPRPPTCDFTSCTFVTGGPRPPLRARAEASAQKRELTLYVGKTNDRRHPIVEDPGQRRQVAGPVVVDLHTFADEGLRRHEAGEIAQSEGAVSLCLAAKQRSPGIVAASLGGMPFGPIDFTRRSLAHETGCRDESATRAHREMEP